MNPPLAISGLVPFSATDFPGQLSAVLFCQGCPWRCRYCHNPELQEFKAGTIEWAAFEEFAVSRRGLLDAIVFSGGEATAQPGLREAMIFCRNLGYRIGLHTAGYSASRLSEILDVVDWVGLDFKTLDSPLESLQSVLNCKVDYEVRTTYHPALISEETLLQMAALLRKCGVEKFALQVFQARGCLDSELIGEGESGTISQKTITVLDSLFPHFTVRR